MLGINKVVEIEVCEGLLAREGGEACVRPDSAQDVVGVSKFSKKVIGNFFILTFQALAPLPTSVEVERR